MPQGVKNKQKAGKGGKSQMSRKSKPAKKSCNGWKAKSNKVLSKNINRNAETIIIERATGAKMRLKIAGQNRVKQWKGLL